MSSAWVYGELTDDGAHSAALECLTKARSLGGSVEAVALGPGAIASADRLGEYGAERVYASDDQVFADHPGGPAAHVLAELIREHHPSLLMFPGTYASREVAARVQVVVGSTLMANVTDVLDIGHARTEIFGGSKIVDVELGGPEPRLVLVRPRSFAAEPTGGVAEVIMVASDVPEESKGARVLERHAGSSAGPKLEEANVVLAGGRGLRGPEAFAMLDQLADAIGGAAVGATRAAVDAGWVPLSYQVGQTGKTVKPDVYIAAGISGALQHVVGMKGSKRIIAINSDADAPILRIADLGVVGDLFELLPALTEEIRRRKRS